MRLASALLVVCAIGFLTADDPKNKDADSPKGKWTAVSISMGGMAVPDEVVKGFKFNLDDKTYTNIIKEEVVEEGEYKIDATMSPKTIDFDIKKGRDDGKKQLGIYKIDGEKLTIVAAVAGSDERPKSFNVESGSQLLELVLEKAKP